MMDFPTEAANGAIHFRHLLRESKILLFLPSIMHDVKIAVIGGSGLYHLDNLEIVEEVNPETVNVNGQRRGLQKEQRSTYCVV